LRVLLCVIRGLERLPFWIEIYRSARFFINLHVHAEIPKILDQTRNHVIDASAISKRVAKVETFQPRFCR